MAKTQEELNALKEDVETLKENLKELTEEELEQDILDDVLCYNNK